MTAQHTTDAEIVDALRALRDADGNKSAAARQSGIDYEQLRRRLRLADRRGLTADSPVMTEMERLRIALRKAQEDLRAAQREQDTAESIRKAIWGLSARTPDPPKWLAAPHTKANARGVPMTVWSDWHYGEVVSPNEVGGVNEFNAEIAKTRINTLVEKIIELSFHHMGDATKDYPGIIVCLGGDLITGDIHEELLATNDRTVQQQINDLTDLLIAAIGRLADVFGRVFVPAVPGNHGRSTRRPRMKGRVYTSHEWNIYCNLERYFRHDKRVSFLIPGEADAYFTVYGHRFLLTHGDSLGVKGGDGIIGAIGPIMRGTLKVGRSEAAVGRDIDTVIMGHWHTPLWLPGAIVNGTLKGYDEYARLEIRAPYSPASQMLWFVHPKTGLTAKWEVYLEPWANKAPTESLLEIWQ